MERRRLLATVGAACTLGTAGCAADADSGSSPADDQRNGADDPTTDPGGGHGDDRPSHGDPVETITVGSRAGVPFADNNHPHDVSVLNDAGEARTVGLTLRADSAVELDRDVDLAAGRSVRLTLNEPATYDIGVTVDGDEAGTVAVERARFDCNGSVTEVTADESGGLDTRTVTTAAACPGPAVAGRAFERGEGTCGEAETATVQFVDERVRVEGRARTPVPCYDLALSSAELRDADDVLVVVVTATEQTGACAGCVGSVSYEASVEFDHAYPSSVRVVHERSGERVTVTEVSP